MAVKYTLVLDDPASYLDERGNPRTGRRLLYRGEDDSTYELTVSLTEYKDPDTVKAKLKALTDAHEALKEV